MNSCVRSEQPCSTALPHEASRLYRSCGPPFDIAPTRSAAPTAVSTPVRVLSRELVAVVAVRASCKPRTRPFAAQDVLGHGHGFEMRRIHASAIATEMIESEIVRDGSDDKAVDDAVATVPRATWSNSELRVAACVETRRPLPAPHLNVDRDLLANACRKCCEGHPRTFVQSSGLRSCAHISSASANGPGRCERPVGVSAYSIHESWMSRSAVPL
jgi:hypothetical protein